jgi:hypothetical protein
MNEGRGSWYLVTGLVLGVAIGLLYAWVVSPTRFVDTFPNALSLEYKDRYRALIAVAYMADGNLVRAKARLDLLKDSDVYTVLAQQAHRSLAAGNNPEEARALGLLSVALGQGTAPPISIATPVTPTLQTTAQAILATVSQRTPDLTSLPTIASTATATYTPQPSATLSETPVISETQVVVSGTVTGTLSSAARRTATPTATLVPTLTPLPTATPSPTPGAPFVLEKQDPICDPNLKEPLIQVQAFDAAGQPVPGVEGVVTWDGGETHFYTGLKSELGPGYADFTMTPGTIYTLRLGEGGQPINGLTAQQCSQPDGGTYWGSLRLQFKQP